MSELQGTFKLLERYANTLSEHFDFRGKDAAVLLSIAENDGDFRKLEYTSDILRMIIRTLDIHDAKFIRFKAYTVTAGMTFYADLEKVIAEFYREDLLNYIDAYDGVPLSTDQVDLLLDYFDNYRKAYEERNGEPGQSTISIARANS
jgi:hypothetical protein